MRVKRYCPQTLVAVGLLSVAGWTASAAKAATFEVDRVDDVATATACTAAADDCSLRGAILAANATLGMDTVVVPAGTYLLSLEGEGGGPEVEDLDVRNPVHIQGAGADVTIIDADGIDRVFTVLLDARIFSDDFESGDTGAWSMDSPARAVFSGLTLRGGFPSINRGGAIFNRSSIVEVEDCHLEDNANTAIYNEAGGSLSIVRSRITNSSGGSGGAIHSEAAVSIVDSTIDGNTANLGGALYLEGSGAVATIERSTLSGNSAIASESRGGALYATDSASFTMVDCTVSGNSSNAQGSAISSNHQATILGSTFTGNTEPGGDTLNLRSPAVFTVANTLIDGACQINMEGTLISLGGNLESPGDTCDFDDLSDQVSVADPLLGPLADNGGPTETHELLAGSPAIDSGVNGQCSTEDQRGMPRPADGDGDETADCDVGAFEVQ